MSEDSNHRNDVLKTQFNHNLILFPALKGCGCAPWDQFKSSHLTEHSQTFVLYLLTCYKILADVSIYRERPSWLTSLRVNRKFFWDFLYHKNSENQNRVYYFFNVAQLAISFLDYPRVLRTEWKTGRPWVVCCCLCQGVVKRHITDIISDSVLPFRSDLHF